MLMKVLIADDERKVGLLVKNLIQWEELGLEFMDIVQDGQTAYEIILEKRPDIVITDIRMPRLSGLDMIQKVTEANISVHFIVISGYRYFEYAQSALKFGVKDYLLKPIDEDELNKILQNVCNEEKCIRGEKKNVQLLKNSLEYNRHILHKELMGRVFEEKDMYEGTSDEETADELERGIFQALGIKVDRDITLPAIKEQEKLITDELSKMIQNTLKPEYRPAVLDLVISVKKGMWIYVLLNFSEEKKEEINRLIKDMFCNMKRYIAGFEHYEITMGYSSQIADFSRINLILEMAAELVRSRIFVGTGICINVFPKEFNRHVKAMDIIAIHAEKIKNFVQIFRIDELISLIRTSFEEAAKENIMACEYYELSENLLMEYCRSVGELFNEETSEIYKKWNEDLESCQSVYAMKNFVMKTVREHMENLEKKQSERERRPILEAIEYVKENYGQKCSLEEISEKLGYNSNYFCEIFKKEMGKNFSTYLLEVRMEEAKKLLRDSSETIYDIALRVGYKDSKFFSKQFTKMIGIKPTEYRRLYF